MEFAERHAITDVCLLVRDLERSMRFYIDRLGFRLRRRAEGFADFTGVGVTLALWEVGHMSRHTGVSRAPASGAHNVIIAVELGSPAEVDACHAELTTKGVAFERGPADYPWNARCCYFAGPDGELWELYAWLDGGPVGAVAPP